MEANTGTHTNEKKVEIANQRKEKKIYDAI